MTFLKPTDDIPPTWVGGIWFWAVVKTSASVVYKCIIKSSGMDKDFRLYVTQKLLVCLALLFIFLASNSPSHGIRPPCAWCLMQRCLDAKMTKGKSQLGSTHNQRWTWNKHLANYVAHPDTKPCKWALKRSTIKSCNRFLKAGASDWSPVLDNGVVNHIPSPDKASVCPQDMITILVAVWLQPHIVSPTLVFFHRCSSGME